MSDTAIDARYSQAQLDQFIAAHERFVRRQAYGRRLSLLYLQAEDMVFNGRELTEADFTGSNLQRAKLVRARLERALLFCADLSGVDAREADFRRADVRGVSLRDANLAGSNLDEADMREAMLARTDVASGFALTGRSGSVSPEGQFVFSVDFSHCSLKRAKLTNAKLKNANFTGALLQGADLKGANLTGARFDDAVMTAANLSGARLDPGALDRCVRPPTAEAMVRAKELLGRLSAAELWIASGGREGQAAMLDDEDLRPLQKAFAGRPLTAMSAKRARAIGVGFAGAQLQGARFDRADLRDADFTGADLRGASFAGANLRHARFDKADVRPLPLPNGARAVCLDGAEMAAGCFDDAVQA